MSRLSCHVKSNHVMPDHFVSPNVRPHHVIRHHATLWQLSCHVTSSHHILSCMSQTSSRAISCQVTSHFFLLHYPSSCQVTSHHVISRQMSKTIQRQTFYVPTVALLKWIMENVGNHWKVKDQDLNWNVLAAVSNHICVKCVVLSRIAGWLSNKYSQREWRKLKFYFFHILLCFSLI